MKHKSNNKFNKKSKLYIGIIILIIVILFLIFRYNRKIYKFNFNDNYVPGSTYIGKINLKSGESYIEIHDSCSVVPVEDCGELDHTYSGTIQEEELKKIRKILKKINYKKSRNLIRAVAHVLNGNEIYNDKTNITYIQQGNKELNELLNMSRWQILFLD